MPLHRQAGFTLVEVLVVVTVMVVLLTMLVPAMDKAIYQAELAVCATHLHGIGVGVSAYAMDQRRWYPYRQGVRETNVWQPYMLNLIPNLAVVYKDQRSEPRPNGYDDRPALRGYISINGLLNDPLCKAVDLDNTQPDSMTTASYDLWFGYGYKNYAGNAAETVQGQKITFARGMYKLGDKFEWDGDEFDLLAGDMDHVDREGSPGGVVGSHPDAGRVMVNQVLQDASTLGPGASAGGLILGAAGSKFTLSRWIAGTFARGLIDTNDVYADGSVKRYADVLPVDDLRMAQVPALENGGHYPLVGNNIPRR